MPAFVGFAEVRAEGTRRLYAVNAQQMREADAWLEQLRGFWTQRLDALGTDIARGRWERRRRRAAARAASAEA